MKDTEGKVGLAWISARDKEERLGVGFTETGKFRIMHWPVTMSVRG
jgi:hypothetical protein